MKANISLNQVQLSIGNHKILHDINLQLSSGKIIGLLGRNGAGKSSLLSIIASFRQATAGSVSLNGQEIFENDDAMEQIGFVYEFDHTDEDNTVMDMLADAARYRPYFDMAYAEHLIQVFDLPSDKPLQTMSKGQRSAFNAALGLAARTPVTLFDEAYVGMDAPTREAFYKELYLDYERHPRTIIFSSHLVAETEYLLEEAVIMHKGRILLHKPVPDLLEQCFFVSGSNEQIKSIATLGKELGREDLGGIVRVLLMDNEEGLLKEAVKQAGMSIQRATLQEIFIQMTKEAAYATAR